MTRRHLIILITVAIVLILQFGVPAIQYFAEGSNRWGWQMYSRENSRPEITAVSTNGNRRAVALSPHLMLSRTELRINDDVLRQLCGRLRETRTLELHYENSDEVRVYQCPD